MRYVCSSHNAEYGISEAYAFHYNTKKQIIIKKLNTKAFPTSSYEETISNKYLQ